MVAHLDIDLDNEARSMRQQLDTAIAVTLASQVKQNEFQLNYSGALVAAITVKANCDFLLRYIPDRDLDNRDRFKALLKEADKATLRFWKYFTVASVETESGRQVQVAAPAKPDNLQNIKPRKLAQHNRGRVLTQETGFSRMSQDQIDEVIETIRTVYGGHLTQAEMAEVAKTYGRGFSTISRLYYKHFGRGA